VPSGLGDGLTLTVAYVGIKLELSSRFTEPASDIMGLGCLLSLGRKF